MTTHSVELTIGGMTCASCAARVEKSLNKLDGVQATVNYATERARVFAPSGVSTETLVAAVEATGYTASRPPVREQKADDVSADSPTQALRQRLVVSALLALPVLAFSMVGPLRSTTGSGRPSPWPRRWWSGVRCPSTGQPGPTRAMAPRRWTR